MAGMLWIGVYVHGSSSQDAWASCCGAGDDVLALGLEDGVALGPSGKVPQRLIMHSTRLWKRSDISYSASGI